MKRNHTRLNTEAHEKQHKRSGLPSARQLCRSPVEAREFGAPAALDQKGKSEEQAPCIDVRHDDVEQPRLSGLLVLMVKRDQPVSGKRHDLPPDQEQKCIGGSKDNRQAEKQDVK